MTFKALPVPSITASCFESTKPYWNQLRTVTRQRWVAETHQSVLNLIIYNPNCRAITLDLVTYVKSYHPISGGGGNYIYYRVWDEMTYPFKTFNGPCKQKGARGGEMRESELLLVWLKTYWIYADTKMFVANIS